MPASTRPRSSRPHTPASPARPRTVRAYVPAEPPVGLTIETEFGFVDLVAVQRALAGDDRVRLNAAENDWIRNRQRPGARRAAAYALGISHDRLRRDLRRYRERHARATAKRTADLGGSPF